VVSVQEVQVLHQHHVEVHHHGVVHQVLVKVLVHHGVAVQEVHHAVHLEVEEDNHEIRIITKRQG